jgi:hypothetical protein
LLEQLFSHEPQMIFELKNESDWALRHRY